MHLGRASALRARICATIHVFGGRSPLKQAPGQRPSHRKAHQKERIRGRRRVGSSPWGRITPPTPIFGGRNLSRGPGGRILCVDRNWIRDRVFGRSGHAWGDIDRFCECWPADAQASPNECVIPLGSVGSQPTPSPMWSIGGARGRPCYRSDGITGRACALEARIWTITRLSGADFGLGGRCARFRADPRFGLASASFVYELLRRGRRSMSRAGAADLLGTPSDAIPRHLLGRDTHSRGRRSCWPRRGCS